MQSPLYIPTHFSVKGELWRGFGYKEGYITALLGVIFIAAAFAGYFILHIDPLLCMAFVIISVSAVITCLQKLENGLSIVDYIAIKKRFAKEQQRYIYKYAYSKENEYK